MNRFYCLLFLNFENSSTKSKLKEVIVTLERSSCLTSLRVCSQLAINETNINDMAVNVINFLLIELMV